MDIFEELSESIVDGNKNKTIELVNKGLAEGLSAIDLLNKGLISGMDTIGALWNEGEVFVPEVLVSARAMRAGTEILEKILLSEGFEPIEKVIVGTVKGDLHDIGKNLVAMMLKGKNFQVIDLGVDVSAEKYIEAVKTHQAKFVVCSSLLTTTMMYMKDIVEAFIAEGLRDKVIIACGGAPVTKEFAMSCGADVYTDDAVSLVKEFLKLV